jgi:hypothetical protein
MSLFQFYLNQALTGGYFTCAFCNANTWCDWAWDGYNTDGDCLGVK